MIEASNVLTRMSDQWIEVILCSLCCWRQRHQFSRLEYCQCVICIRSMEFIWNGTADNFRSVGSPVSSHPKHGVNVFVTRIQNFRHPCVFVTKFHEASQTQWIEFPSTFHRWHYGQALCSREQGINCHLLKCYRFGYLSFEIRAIKMKYVV